jgi:hypothetical protein
MQFGLLALAIIKTMQVYLHVLLVQCHQLIKQIVHAAVIYGVWNDKADYVQMLFQNNRTGYMFVLLPKKIAVINFFMLCGANLYPMVWTCINSFEAIQIYNLRYTLAKANSNVSTLTQPLNSEASEVG